MKGKQHVHIEVENSNNRFNQFDGSRCSHTRVSSIVFAYLLFLSDGYGVARKTRIISGRFRRSIGS